MTNATTQEVLTAMGTIPLLRGEIIRQVANWKGVYASQISPHSVDKALEALMSTSEVIRLKGDHWAIQSSSRREQTYNLASSAKPLIAEQLNQAERDVVKHRAEEEATRIIMSRHYDEWRQERDAIIAAVAPPDYESLWEET